MQRALTLGLALLVYAAAEQPEELLLDTEEVDSKEQTNFEINKISLDQELCSKTLQPDGVFCPRASNPSCFCEDNRCSCCLHLKLGLLNIDNNICVEMAYNDADKSMRLALKVNKLPLISTGFPFLKPTEKPVCVGLSIIGTNVCVHFSDMSIIAGRPNFCASLVLNLFGKTIFTFKIGCFEYLAPLGSDLRNVGFLVPADSYTRNITVVIDNTVS